MAAIIIPSTGVSGRNSNPQHWGQWVEKTNTIYWWSLILNAVFWWQWHYYYYPHLLHWQ